MFVFRVVVTTLVSLLLLIIGLSIPNAMKKNDNVSKAILCIITILFMLCIVGMWVK